MHLTVPFTGLSSLQGSWLSSPCETWAGSSSLSFSIPLNHLGNSGTRLLGACEVSPALRLPPVLLHVPCRGASGHCPLDALAAVVGPPFSPCVPNTLQLIYGHQRLVPADQSPTAPVLA